jgi:hypothetical protein
MQEGRDVTQMDLNPFLFMPQGQGCLALDAVVFKEESA